MVVVLLITKFHLSSTASVGVQGYLAHKKQPPPLGPPQDPGYTGTVGSCLGHYRGTSLIRNRNPVGRYGGLMSGALQGHLAEIVPLYDPTVGSCLGHYRGTSLVRNRAPVGPNRRLMSRALQGYLAHQKSQPPRTLQ